ncbi:MAG TPA: hypothetical protein VGL71_10250, partial [Urbifossiella sp.]
SLSPAAVVVLGNFTPAEISVTITEPKQKPQTITIDKAQVVPVTVGGPCEVTFAAKSEKATLRLDPYHAYVFIPDQKTDRRLEGIAMPGEAPERDSRPELNPLPKEPLKIPVKLLVDDADPRADALWRKTLRKRFDEAAAVIEANANVKLEFAGFDTWNSDPETKDINELLADFTAKVTVKPSALAIGYTSRIKVDRKEPQNLVPFGAVKPFPTGHILLRESGPRADPEKVEAMIQHIGLALGATLVDPEKDGGTVMRAKIADGLALHPQYRFRFDPLNVLAMNIWVEELRRGPLGKPGDASDAAKARLTRVYKALLLERPGDSNSLVYLDEFDRDMAKAPVKPKEKDPEPNANPNPAAKVEPKVDPAAAIMQSRDQVARHVIRAVVSRARSNIGAVAITGDALTEEYVKAAAAAAWREDGLSADPDQRVGGFLIGLGVALDDSDGLLNDPATAEAVKAVETEAERIERLKVLGNPTLRNRRDLCRRFAMGCGAGELLRTVSQAEEIALDRSFSKAAFDRPIGVNFSALAAEFAGIEFARLAATDSIHTKRLAGESSLSGILPEFTGLRDGLSRERFQEDYGDTADARFQKVLADIRSRVRKSKG